ncbi:hypothetical protein [Bartonella rattaustraliani]|uniref:hypothetical protein n=1 Tax=Bartonella rattaustraliani TaxID=481139 RepID=UPI001FCBE119|nr:hypothetical protein [Bartonella rattaustraliani]
MADFLGAPAEQLFPDHYLESHHRILKPSSVNSKKRHNAESHRSKQKRYGVYSE